MSILHSFDPDSQEIIRPADMVSPVSDFPETVLAVFNPKFLNILGERSSLTEIPDETTRCHFPLYTLVHENVRLGFSVVSTCGPGAAGDLEALLALGAKRVLFFGSAGALYQSITPGQIIVPTAAYRDEGISYHYALPGDYIDVPTAAHLAAVLDRLGVDYLLARTWTTDAFYRETRWNLELRRSEGCAVVEQECASVMAVGQFRSREIYHFLYAADCLDGARWDSRIFGRTPQELRAQILDIALNAAVQL